MMTIRELSKVFNFEIRDFQLFLNAFTHSSYAFETFAKIFSSDDNSILFLIKLLLFFVIGVSVKW